MITPKKQGLTSSLLLQYKKMYDFSLCCPDIDTLSGIPENTGYSQIIITMIIL